MSRKPARAMRRGGEDHVLLREQHDRVLHGAHGAGIRAEGHAKQDDCAQVVPLPRSPVQPAAAHQQGHGEEDSRPEAELGCDLLPVLAGALPGQCRGLLQPAPDFIRGDGEAGQGL